MMKIYPSISHSVSQSVRENLWKQTVKKLHHYTNLMFHNKNINLKTKIIYHILKSER